MLVIKQRQLDRTALREKKILQKENFEIDSMNAPIILSPGNYSKKRKREEILEDFDELLEELTEKIDEEENLDDTMQGSILN